jgi:ribosomal protein L34E
VNATPERCPGCTAVLEAAPRYYRADGGRVCANCFEQARAKIYPCASCGRNFTTIDWADPIAARAEHEVNCTDHPRSARR